MPLFGFNSGRLERKVCVCTCMQEQHPWCEETEKRTGSVHIGDNSGG